MKNFFVAMGNGAPETNDVFALSAEDRGTSVRTALCCNAGVDDQAQTPQSARFSEEQRKIREVSQNVGVRCVQLSDSVDAFSQAVDVEDDDVELVPFAVERERERERERECLCRRRSPCYAHGDPAADQIVRGPSGGCRGDLISTPDFGYSRVFYKSFLWGNLRFGGCFEKPSLQAWFWYKKLRSKQKIGKVTKRRRSVKPTCANGGTNRANGGTNASFCTSGDFPFFLACGQICFEFESATVKREKKRRKNEGKERVWPKAKRKDFFNFSHGFVFKEGNRRLFTPGAKNF